MAKGNFNGLIRGKLGNSVFYKIKNSNNSQKQGIRERVREVSNPQSSAQASQRMKMLPAQRFANVLRPVIERGFEGVKYGAMSRQQFMKYALAMTEGFPAVSKDDPNIYPGKYLVSKGSLPVVACELIEADVLLGTSLGCDNTSAQWDGTIGGFSRSLLEKNGWLQEGDQITAIAGVVSDQTLGINSPIIWVTKSFIIDTLNTEEMEVSGDLWFDANITQLRCGTDLDCFAAGTVIVSRESTTGGHLRSTQSLVVSTVYNELFTSAAINEARKSYMKKNAALNSDWPVVPEIETDLEPEDYVQNIAFGNYGNKAQFVPAEIWISTEMIDELGDTTKTGKLCTVNNMVITVDADSTTFPSSENRARQLTTAEAAALRAAGYTVPGTVVSNG